MKRFASALFLTLSLSAAALNAKPVDWEHFIVTRSLDGVALPTRAEHLACFPERPFRLVSLQTVSPLRDDPREEGTVMLMVNAGLYDALEDEFNLWIDDIRQEGYTVIRAAVENGTPSEVKEFVFRQGGEDLVGVIFAGAAPLAFMEHREHFNGEDQPDNQRIVEYPIDLFFMDRDGVWEDTTGNGVYDYHHGNVLPEIWLGRLPAYNLSHIDEVPFVQAYLYRIHAYRQGELTLPHRALCFIDDDWALSAPAWARSMKYVYGRVMIENQPDSTSATLYRRYLEGEGQELVQVAVHSTSDSHSFYITVNDRRTRDYFRYFDLRDEVTPHSMFYNLFACSIMNMSGDHNLCMGALYAMKGPYGMGSVGSTKTGGMLFWDDYYRPLSEGAGFGEALRLWMLDHICEPERPNWARSWFYGMTHYGDPTLKIYLGLRARSLEVNDETGDADGVLDAGEQAILTLPVVNLGATDYSQIEVSISSDDPLIEVVQGAGFIPSIISGGEAAAEGFEISAAAATPDDHVVLLNVALAPLEGEPWLDQIELPVRTTRFEVAGLGWDETAGDGDRLVGPGESGLISLHFRNVGGDDMRRAGRAEIISLDGRFILDDDPDCVLPPARSGATSRMLMSPFHIDPNMVDAAVFLRVRGSVGDIFRGEGIVAMPCRSDFQLEEGFDSQPVWSRHYALREGFTDPWRWGSVEAGAVGVISAGGPDSVFYEPNCDAAFELPLMMYSRVATLELRHRLDVEAMFDACVVEVDRGNGWRRADPEGGYNGQSVSNGSFSGGRCWNGSFDWMTSRVPLGGPAGPLRIRLRFSSDSGVEGMGWQIDYLRLDGVPLDIEKTTALPAEFSLKSAYPNPFNNRLTVDFSLAEAGPTRLTLRDLTGRVVRTLTDESCAAGRHRRTFDLESLPSSIYVLELAQRQDKTGLKVVLLK